MNRSGFVIIVAIAVFFSLVFQTSCSGPDEIPKSGTGSQRPSGSGSAPAATGPFIWPVVAEGEVLQAASDLLATN